MSKKPFQLIDGSMTMHGIRFLMSGGRMERFEANPVMLYMHIRGNVIGSWANLRLDGDAYVADPVFDDEDPAVKEIARKVEKKFLRACSMGVIIHKLELIDGLPTAIEWEPYEGSIVDVGSNANSLVLYTPDGEMVQDTENHVKNLTFSIMSETKKPVPGTEGAPEIVAVPKEIALAAGLAEDATVSLVASQITTILTENKNLKLAAKAAKDKEVKDLIDLAVKDGKIVEADRVHYETLATTSFDSVKIILNNMAKPVDLVEHAKKGSTEAKDTVNLAAEYDKLDKAGTLYQLQASDLERFKTLYEARWAVKYKEA